MVKRNGLYIRGLTTELARYVDDSYPESDLAPRREESAWGDPVYLSEDMVDVAIAGGTLSAGSLNGMQVSPPRNTWPPRWHMLKDPETE